jgi:dTDP-4-dehydrorhamnose 3,5-epimerase
MGRTVRGPVAEARAGAVRFIETPLPGAWIIELDLLVDERGWFARTFDAEEFRARNMNPDVVECSLSFNSRRDTLRGLHYQAEPYGESKLVRCIRGAIFDVAVDLRADGHTYCRWHGVELSADNRRAFYIPAGVAHGYQTLTDDVEVLYQMGNPYTPEAARGVRFDDPAFGIRWPEPRGQRILSERDASYPDFTS